jgi:hypothetical protein
MVKCGVLFDARTEFLNIIFSLAFKGLSEFIAINTGEHSCFDKCNIYPAHKIKHSASIS